MSGGTPLGPCGCLAAVCVWVWGLGVPDPQCCGTRLLVKVPSGAKIGLGLAPRRLADVIQRLCGRWRGGMSEGTEEGIVGPKVWSSGHSKVDSGSEFPAHSPTLNERWCPVRPMWWPGGSVSLPLGVGCAQSPALQCQDPGEGPLWGRPRIRVSTQEAHRPEPKAVWLAEWWT